MQKMPSMHGGRSRAATAKLRKSDAGAGAGVLAAVLVAISLLVFTVSARDGGTGFFGQLRGGMQMVTAPLQLMGSAITSPFTGLGNVFKNLTADGQTLVELQQENERLVARNVELEEAEQSAQRLQELLQLRDNYSLQSMAARVISGSTDSWTSSVVIDRGTSSGLAVGMPVTSETGAIGQIISCSPTTATVRLLNDEASSVSAMLQKSRAQGMLQGSVDGKLRLTLIRTDQNVQVGDVVVTSGLGGVFPKGLPLGKVASVQSSPGEGFYEIEVEPNARIANLEEVLVITSLTEEQQASDDDITNADANDLNSAVGHNAKRLVPEGEGGEPSEDDGESTADDTSSQTGDETMDQQANSGTQSQQDTQSRDISGTGTIGNAQSTARETEQANSSGGTVSDAG